MVVEGILNIDKPGGMTSHDVVNQIRRLAGIRRVGHAGTLDPLATGVLLICLGRATRLVEYLMGQHKVYEATVRLGQTTNTYDAEGEIVSERPVSGVTSTLLAEALSHFQGSIQQRPPMYSALKKDGQPLYKLARKGIDVERPLRQVTINTLELLKWESPDLHLLVSCSSGTYIRSLAHDLGEVLGCGGHIKTLRRTAIGDFDVASAVTLTELSQDSLTTHMQESDTAVIHLPRLDLSTFEAEKVQQGQRIQVQPDHPQAPLARAYNAGSQFIGIIAIDELMWQPRKIFHPETNEPMTK